MNIRSALCLCGILAGVCSCSSLSPSGAPPLRVGFTPNYPPICTETFDGPAGLEFDFARALAQAMHRPLELMEMPWEKQIPALLAGKTDLIMSGMTVTPARAARVTFCEPYMSNPLVAMGRADESNVPTSPEEGLSTTANIGVLGHTSAESYVRKQYPQARIVALSGRTDAPMLLKSRRIDYYIDDLAAIADLVARDEAQLSVLPFPLKEQKLAWAVRPEETALQAEANRVLAQWKQSGELDTMINRWMPYRRLLSTGP